VIAPWAFIAALAVSPAPSPAAVPAIPVTGDLVRPGFVFDATARAAVPRTSVSGTDPDASVATYDGVALADIVHAAGANVGDAVRGAAALSYLAVRASDGYVAVFSLAELRGAETRCTPILADARAGSPLAAAVGPVRVVAPCDLTHARWVRGVVSLSILVTLGAETSMPSHH
jgi:hypothetical protein